jgi:hypothetical protein
MRVGALTVLLLASSPVAAQIFSPGKLSAPHGFLDKSCTPCHGGEGGGKVTNDKCLACHKVLRARVAAGRGFHARLRGRRCVACHGEHKGPRHALIKWPGGQRAFDHRRAGYPLAGKHKKLSCRSCHQPKHHQAAAVRGLSAKRRKRTFLGLSRACSGCHRDPHRGEAGSRCERCHGQQGFKPILNSAGHRTKRFPLVGGHKKAACRACHKSGFKGLSTRCGSCHKTVHGRFMGQGRDQERLDCGACHTPLTWNRIAFARRLHPGSLPLRGGHARTACRKCHGAKASRKPPGTRCNACHRDTHKRRFAGSCSRCHGLGSWRVKPSRLPEGKMTGMQRESAVLAGVPLSKVKTITFHNKTRYPLTGKHIVVGCQRCHRRGRRRGQRSRIKFAKSFRRCADCHRDEHRGQFRDHMTVAARLTGQCEGCHPLGGLAITSFSVERHAKSRFPLRGAHRAVPCRTCHSPGRPKARRFTFKRRDCRACHRDRHRGRFRGRDGKPLACDTCHGVTTFREASFDHQKTKFPLQGKHAGTACSSCHRPDKRGVTVFSAASRACSGCHADPHQGQFRIGKRSRGCADCHSAKDKTFKLPRFDHAKRTGFALDGKHRKLRCGRCHNEVRLGGGKRATLYRLGRRTCNACHRPRHRAARRSKAPIAPDASMSRCEDCHDSRGWRVTLNRPKRFNHAVVGYRLRGRHRTARCNACHRPHRAISRQCGTCHADRHRGRLGKACANCHTPSSWRPSATLARHRKTKLPLTGWHALADCSSCHPRARDGDYRGVPTTCYGCHGKAYNDPKTHPDHRRSGFSRSCEQCHRPTGWVPAAFSRSTAGLRRSHPFALRGKHARQACTACHRGRRPSPRCASCHTADRARARAPSHAAPIFSRRCDRCHGDTAWRPARPSVHGSRFPLTGRHRGLPCGSCHTDPTRFARYSCVGCHDRRSMAGRHRRAAGYVHESRACRRCHPLGRK